MNIIVVDDEKLILDDLLEKLRLVNPHGIIRGFQRSEEALAEIEQGFYPRVAFLDIEMYGLNGIELAIRFKKALPELNLIFVTGHEEYAQDAFALRASGYITKPVRVERIREELNNLRNPVPASNARIQARTFGRFEVLVDGEPLKFKRSRTKELLAYLVDLRGTGCTIAELAAALWEDRNYNRSLLNQLQVHISDLMSTLKKAGAENMIIRSHNFIAVETGRFDCDAYRLLAGNAAAINSYAGTYMAGYAWAELTTGRLNEKTMKNGTGEGR